MKISQSGVDAIKAHEGLRLLAYPDPASGGDPWTIGYGSTNGVTRGMSITEAEAEERLRADLAWVEQCIADTVTAPLTQGQYDALCSLIFNIGAGAFKKSTLLKLLNMRDYAGAAAQFGRWNIADGKVMPGLVKRRLIEQRMFTEQDEEPRPLPAPMPNPPRPDIDPEHVPEPKMALPAIVAAVLPSIIEAIPKLGGLFGSGSKVADRNVKAAETVVEIVRNATGAVNAQDAAEKLKSDPAAVVAATKAIEGAWFDLVEGGGGGIDGARKADADARKSGDLLQSPSFWFTVGVLPAVYLVVGSVVGLWGGEWPSGVRAAIATAVVSLIVGGGAGYYWGQSTSRNRTPQ